MDITKEQPHYVRVIWSYKWSSYAKEFGWTDMMVLLHYKHLNEEVVIETKLFNSYEEAVAYEMGINDTDDDYYTEVINWRIEHRWSEWFDYLFDEDGNFNINQLLDKDENLNINPII